jgi:hypothetical protein
MYIMYRGCGVGWEAAFYRGQSFFYRSSSSFFYFFLTLFLKSQDVRIGQGIILRSMGSENRFYRGLDD